MFSLKGKTAMVTGSSQGIGSGIVEILATAGANVVIGDLVPPNDLNQTLTALSSHDNQAFFIQGDVTDPQTRRRFIDEGMAKTGRLDILVNNAGAFFDGGWDNLSEETISKTLDLNVKAMLMMAKLAIDSFRTSGRGGSIVNLASVNSFAAEHDSICYDISKGAILMMTRTLAVEAFKDNININALCPGIVDTSLFRNAVGDEEQQRKVAAGIPCGRLCSPQECGYAVLYMVSDEGRYMTGQHIILDGGILAVQATFVQHGGD